MFDYSQSLKELQNQLEQFESDDSLNCLSVYLPFNKDSQTGSASEVASAHFKSLVEKEIQKQLPLTEQKQLRLSIIAEISLLSGTFDLSKRGVCVYATFRTGSVFHGGNKKISNQDIVPFVQAIPLFTLPTQKSSSFVGQVFDLIPLLDNLNFDKTVLVIDFHQDQALLYEFAQTQLKLLTIVENSYVKFPEREQYLDQSQGHHSNRQDHDYIEDYLHQFLRDDLTSTLNKYVDQYKILTIICPVQYQSQISKFSGEFKNQFSEIQISHLVTNKTLELLHKHLSSMEQNQIETSRQMTKKSLNDFSNKLETDLETISKAAKNGQIERVFIIPNYHTPGFIDDQKDELNQKNLQITREIIQNVIKFGGKVVAISGDLLESADGSIFAILRF